MGQGTSRPVELPGQGLLAPSALPLLQTHPFYISSSHVHVVGLMSIGCCHARPTLYPLPILAKALVSDPTLTNVLWALWSLALRVKATCSAVRQHG